MEKYICNKKGRRASCPQCIHGKPHDLVENEKCNESSECTGTDILSGNYGEIPVKCKPIEISKMTPDRELNIYRDLLLKIHTANWTFDNKKLRTIMLAIANYSYARTNTNEGNTKQENELKMKTLLNLEKL